MNNSLGTDSVGEEREGSPDVERPTLSTVSEQAGVSPMTVSRVMAGHPYVSDKVRERVERIVRDTGYRPNLIARGLRTNQSLAVGLAITDTSNPFNALKVQGADRILGAAGYSLITATSAGDIARDTKLVGLLEERRVDGVLWAVVDEQDPAISKVLSTSRVPIVLLNRKVEGVPVDCVTADHFTSSRETGLELARNGHRRVGIIVGPLGQWPNRERLRGFHAVASEIPFEDDPALVVESAPDAASGYSATRAILGLSERPTALIAGGNRIALGMLRYLAQTRSRIPDDVSVVINSGSEYLEFHAPQMANVSPPISAIAEAATRLVLQRIHGKGPGEHQHINLPCEYTPGESIGPVRAVRGIGEQ